MFVLITQFHIWSSPPYTTICWSQGVMGKWTDKLYITHGEWKSGQFRGGLCRERQQEMQEADFKKLPFDHCALSLRPFTVPVCTRQGIVFDLEEIERFLRLSSDDPTKCPVTGEPLKLSDLTKLTFCVNAAGEYACPVSGRVFSENTKVFANTKTGHAYSLEAMEQMLETGIDFCANVKCRRSDFVCIVDPETSGIHRNFAGRAESAKASGRGPAVIEIPSGTSRSTGQVAASLTSTVMGPVLRQEYKQVHSHAPLRNAKVVFKTTHGDMEAVLFAPMCPVTVYNFIARAKRGDYCNFPIDQIIAGQAVVAGDGHSPLPSEVEEKANPKLSHDSRGIISMCTGDPLTMQFYIALAPLPQCDGVNKVFGKLSIEHPPTRTTLQGLASIGCSPHGSPQEYCAVLDIAVMQDPFTRAEGEAIERAKNKPAPVKVAKRQAKVGKYLNL